MMIFKIFREAEFASLKANGQTRGAPIDLQDGYIHCSTVETVQETASKHFADEDGLILTAVDADALGDALRWEVSRGGIEFPHLYAPLKLEYIVSASPLPKRDGVFDFTGLL